MSTPFDLNPTGLVYQAQVAQNLRSGPFTFNPNDFTGTWQGTDKAINTSGLVTTHKVVTLVCGNNGELTGTVSYTVITGTGFDSTNNPTPDDTEDVLGLVNTSTGEIALVETAETGTFVGKLENNFLILRQTQPGSQPLVAFMKLPKTS